MKGIRNETQTVCPDAIEQLDKSKWQVKAEKPKQIPRIRVREDDPETRELDESCDMTVTWNAWQDKLPQVPGKGFFDPIGSPIRLESLVIGIDRQHFNKTLVYDLINVH